MRKKLLALLAVVLCLAMVLGMTACNKDEGTSSSGDSGETVDISTLEKWGEVMKSKYDGTTITAAMASHPSTTAFQKMVDEFTELTGIKVEWDVVEETNLKQKELTDATAGGTYDVMMVDAFWMSEFASKNVLVPIEDYVNNPNMTPSGSTMRTS